MEDIKNRHVFIPRDNSKMVVGDHCVYNLSHLEKINEIQFKFSLVFGSAGYLSIGFACFIFLTVNSIHV